MVGSYGARFWSKVRRGRPDECWEWAAARHVTGYGAFRLGAIIAYAHRVAWELTHGPIHDGLFVCHHCDNPPCVNPAHLYLGTPADNMRDKVERGRNVFPNLRGEAHPHAKLTASDVEEIRAARSRGVSGVALARRYGVDHTTIYRIANGKSWVGPGVVQCS